MYRGLYWRNRNSREKPIGSHLWTDIRRVGVMEIPGGGGGRQDERLDELEIVIFPGEAKLDPQGAIKIVFVRCISVWKIA